MLTVHVAAVTEIVWIQSWRALVAKLHSILLGLGYVIGSGNKHCIVDLRVEYYVISEHICCFSCALVTCEIQLFWNNFKIIAVFYFTCNHVWNWNIIISATEGVLKLFQNYFSDNEHVGKYSWAAISLWNNFKQVSAWRNKIISDGCRWRL